MERIVINKESLEKTSEVHLLPCKVSYDGEANVKSYFSSSILSKPSCDDSKAES